MKRSNILLAGILLCISVLLPAREIMAYAPDTDVISLRDKTAEDFGEDFIAGTSITGNEINDKKLMNLVTTHFNGVTLGNELKPDCMFGYSNEHCPGTETVTLNGEELEVPRLTFAGAEKYLDYILTWNEQNPEQQIRLRGHVLVWHSQTPEWFFHEDYDASKPFVSAEIMDKRQEWYIKSVLTHFTGKDSEYKDLFYGWDVLNEAISDSRGTYRNDSEGSNWWAVYQSNEYIISAFKYANKYAPESVKLYYNDYNECTPSKIKGIEELLTAVKEAPGTRIDGMGMQGHYDINYPTVAAFKEAAKRYCSIVDEVMLTELDFKASSLYDGTDKTLKSEYIRQAARYRDIYEAMKEVNADREALFTGMTVWGVIDRNSWLQAYTGVGGGVTDGRAQCPLLFDDHYEPKPAFYGITDPQRPDDMTEEVNETVTGEEDCESAAVEEDKDIAQMTEENEKAPEVAATDDPGRGHVAGLIVMVMLIALTVLCIRRP